MAINEEIISKYIVKPSSPTPNTFKHHNLNFIDQGSPEIYTSLVFFYQNDESKPIHHLEISQLLRQSLSQILTVFYPLAGTIRDNLFVDCDDTGVEFIEARVHAPLARFRDNPNMEELNQLSPIDCVSHSDKAILLVKVSFFDCGGIAIGVCLTHKVADMSSFMLFMGAWAANCRRETLITQPSFNLAVDFPPKHSTPSYSGPVRERIATNRLVFEKEKLQRLKQEMASTEIKNPTTVEALTVFIWKSFIESTKAIRGAEKSSFIALHAVNLRPKRNPPIPDHSFGTCSIGCFAFTSDGTDSSELLSKLRVAIKGVDDNYVRNLTMDEYMRIGDEVGDLLRSGAESCTFTSWWRFPMYNVDFGWGKPVWVCTTSLPYKNSVALMTTPSGEGIEAWITMSQDFFQMLKTNYNKLLN